MSSISRRVCVSRCRPPRGTTGAGQRHVDALALQLVGQLPRRDHRLALGEHRLDRLAELVQALADRAALLGRQRGDAAQALRQLGVAAQQRDAGLLERSRAARRRRCAPAPPAAAGRGRPSSAAESIVRAVTEDPYAGIAAIYDHWCAEVTEDVPFYRAGLRRRGRPDRRDRRRHRPDRDPAGAGRAPRDRGRPLAPDARAARRPRGGGRRGRPHRAASRPTCGRCRSCLAPIA